MKQFGKMMTIEPTKRPLIVCNCRRNVYRAGGKLRSRCVIRIKGTLPQRLILASETLMTRRYTTASHESTTLMRERGLWSCSQATSTRRWAGWGGWGGGRGPHNTRSPGRGPTIPVTQAESLQYPKPKPRPYNTRSPWRGPAVY